MTMIKRNFLIGTITLGLVYLSFLSRPEWVPMHAWNRAFADVSLLLLFVTLLIGPLGKLQKHFNRFISWRRELGVWCAVTALLHVYVLFDGWFQWELIRMIIGVNQDSGRLTFDPGFTLANLLGLISLVYLLLLALISNKKAIKILGKQAWDYLQQKSSILYILVVTHTAFFLFFFRLGSVNWIEVPFLVMITLLFLLQWTVFFLSMFKKTRRSDQE